tara:strand:- start:1118 stop:2356 length:1239 start_codon:yes stop_codon:yes gene_type:complete
MVAQQIRVKRRIAVIGGGAAGFFAAIHAASPDTEVVLFEKSNKLLSKVRVSGGGRCNVLHHCPYASELIKAYPRGGRSLKKAFGRFGYPEARAWFEEQGLELKVEADGRVFPKSDSSESVIQVLEKAAQKAGVRIQMQKDLIQLEATENGYQLQFRDRSLYDCEVVILALGGQPKENGYAFLKDFDLNWVAPCPSLFTFNVPQSPLKDLMGLSVPNAWVQIPATKWKEQGPLLITHWGFSGPAVLKLSAWYAPDLKERNYQFPILINWLGLSEEEARTQLQEYFSAHPAKGVANSRAFDLPSRLWKAILQLAEVQESKSNRDLSKKEFNRLLEFLLRSPFNVSGKTTFKEEFVTAGGLDLRELDMQTYALKKYPGLYAIGEFVNVDAITGGYNFQHAWTSAFLAGRAAAQLN